MIALQCTRAQLLLQASNPTAKPSTGAAASKKNSKFLPFVDAHTYALSLKLKSKQEWNVWSKTGGRPPNIPSAPERYYKHGGWQGWGHWLGSSNQMTKVFLPFDHAHAYALSLTLKTLYEWNLWSKSGGRPPNIPSGPERVYKHGGWQGWGHWLGTGNQKNTANVFLPFDEAHAYALSLTLQGVSEWNAWRKSGARPANIPSTPDHVYKHGGWQGWGHWLGTGNDKGWATRKKPSTVTPMARTNKPAPRPRASSTARGRNPSHGLVPPSARLRADRVTGNGGPGDPQARTTDHRGTHWAMCLLCKDEQRNTVLKPGNHICLCQECGQLPLSQSFTVCPYCSTSVKSVLKVFT